LKQHIHFILTGGTIDSIFDAAQDMVVVNDSSSIDEYLTSTVRPHFSISKEILTMKDSRDITDNIRAELVSSIEKSEHKHFIVTHGTYTMADTANYLKNNCNLNGKTVVLTGSMYPLKGFSPSDAPFNIGFAAGSLLLAESGIYLAMNGRLFGADEAVKNVDAGKFEAV
jgi:L-asparaginase